MQVIETTALVGSHGMLRLEVPLEQRDQDVRVAVVVESARAPSAAAETSGDAWSAIRGRLEAAGIRVPPPGVNNTGPVTAIELPGLSASQMFINDRR